MIKNGAELLTVSGNNDSSAKNLDLEDAIETAKDFVKRAGIEQMECVWSDIVDNDAYINLAPIQNDTIIYPDLIKVKIDLATGNVLGYESSSFYTNHTNRQIENPQITDEQAKNLVPKGYNVLSCKNALAPLEYGREVLCKEVKCTKDGELYYMYFNAQNSECENVLKVVETDNGNLLI
jgi:germination protein YpeB